ncbi:hypothetical protein N7455_008895 [Penicillium solitum]|uniref:uncharacterized protein n=1 Tax=Penicillium solitum TaxID=60172 RepID=UPI0032C44846|nr:hypothetical protein N7455_008895 [Penicillium solitum]
MHFTHLLLLLLTVPLAAATPNPQPGINYLIDYVTNIAESAADLGGGEFATNIYNEATSLVDAVQTGDTYSSMVSKANDIAIDSSDSTPTHEAQTSPAEGLRAHGAAACLGYGVVAFFGVIVAL